MLSLEALEERIGYVFQDKKLLRRAVTHRSFAQEHNERLEFLGDSVLNCVIGYALFCVTNTSTKASSHECAPISCVKRRSTKLP